MVVRRCCGPGVDGDGARVALQTRGGDDEVKLAMMKPVEVVACPERPVEARRGGWSSDRRRRGRVARTARTAAGKVTQKNSEGAYEGEKEEGRGLGLGHLLWSPE